MNCLCLQHVPFEGPAYLKDWARSRGHILKTIEVWKKEPFPGDPEYDALFVLGGPMNVDQEKQYPWLIDEKRFLEQAVRKQKPILGICLGAQLLAVVLGGSVVRNREKEIGWFPVTLTDEGLGSRFFAGFPKEFVAFHWHGDRINLPTKAALLASSKACEEQAFSYGENILGLQFHLESNQENIEKLIEHCGHEMDKGPWVQTAQEIHENAPPLSEVYAWLDGSLDALAK